MSRAPHVSIPCGSGQSAPADSAEAFRRHSLRERIALHPTRRTSVRDRTPITAELNEPTAAAVTDGRCRATCALLQRLFCRRCCCARSSARAEASVGQKSLGRDHRRLSSLRESVGSLPQKVIAIPRLAKHYASGRLAEPSIQFGSKLVEPTAAREALVAPVRSAKLNVKRWLRLSILSTLVFGLLAISWHALNCHLWIQLLHMDRAFFLVLPPAIGTVLVLYGGFQTWRWVADLPEAILLKAIAEGLGVDDEGIETFRDAAAQFNRTIDSLEQA